MAKKPITNTRLPNRCGGSSGSVTKSEASNAWKPIVPRRPRTRGAMTRQLDHGYLEPPYDNANRTEMADVITKKLPNQSKRVILSLKAFRLLVRVEEDHQKRERHYADREIDVEDPSPGDLLNLGASVSP